MSDDATLAVLLCQLDNPLPGVLAFVDVSRIPPAIATYCMDAPGARPWLRQYLHDGAAAVQRSGRRAGVDVRLVNALEPGATAAELARASSGVIVLGGSDVTPGCYGCEVETDTLSATYPHADGFEIELIREAMQLGRPVLGICRGMQLLNVACGGTLIQDLGAGSMHTVPMEGDSTTNHNVELVEGSLAHSVWGTRVLSVRSDHHQAVLHLGTGLVASGLAGDGVIEAIEAHTGWCLGVQWHPEDPGSPAGQLDALLAAFAHAAAQQD